MSSEVNNHIVIDPNFVGYIQLPFNDNETDFDDFHTAIGGDDEHDPNLGDLDDGTDFFSIYDNDDYDTISSISTLPTGEVNSSIS